MIAIFKTYVDPTFKENFRRLYLDENIPKNGMERTASRVC